MFLIAAKRLLIPLVIAVAIWYLIESLSIGLRSITFGKGKGKYIPRWLSVIFSAVFILGTFILGIQIIIQNFEGMGQVLPKYEEQFIGFLEYVGEVLELEQVPGFRDLINQLNIPSLVGPLVDTLTNLIASTILVLIYVIFLLLERNSIKVKLKKIAGEGKRYNHFHTVMSQINDSIRTYITVKIFTSFLTGLLSYTVMIFIGLEFALFWAFLIFLLNFIPSLGSISATSLPLLFSLVQFDSLGTFVLLLILLVGVQILVGNYIDPRMMGSRLNISPLVILFSLVAWGSIWGFAGMIFSVPIMAVLIIIFAQFPDTRPIAIMLSANGETDIRHLGKRKSK